MTSPIFMDQDSANIEQRHYWHKKHHTYDYDFLIGNSLISTGVDDKFMDLESSAQLHHPPTQMDEQPTHRSGPSRQPLTVVHFSPNSLTGKQKIDKPPIAGKKLSRDYGSQEHRKSGVLSIRQLKKMKEDGLFQGTDKSDQYMFSYLGAVGFYSKNQAEEISNLAKIINNIKERIQIVKSEHQGPYVEFALITERWMLAYCIAVQGLIEDISSGQQNRKQMIIKALSVYYKQGSNDPCRGREKNMNKNTTAYLQSFNQ